MRDYERAVTDLIMNTENGGQPKKDSEGYEIVDSIIQEDNTFVVNGLQSGSYLIEISNPDYVYEATRVDINAKGKIRARKVNNVQPTQVTQVYMA